MTSIFYFLLAIGVLGLDVNDYMMQLSFDLFNIKTKRKTWGEEEDTLELSGMYMYREIAR